jgi:hypothetical protein
VFTMYFVVFTVNIIKWSGSHNTRFYTVTTVLFIIQIEIRDFLACSVAVAVTKLANSDRQIPWYGMAAIFRYFAIFVVRCVRCTCGKI